MLSLMAFFYMAVLTDRAFIIKDWGDLHDVFQQKQIKWSWGPQYDYGDGKATVYTRFYGPETLREVEHRFFSKDLKQFHPNARMLLFDNNKVKICGGNS